MEKQASKQNPIQGPTQHDDTKKKGLNKATRFFLNAGEVSTLPTPLPPFLPCYCSHYNFCSCFFLKQRRRSGSHASQLQGGPFYRPWLQGTSYSFVGCRGVPWGHSDQEEHQGGQEVAFDLVEEVGAYEQHEDYRKTQRRKKSANKRFPTLSQFFFK